MKMTIIWGLLLSVLLASCKSHRDTIVETRIERDTVYQAQMKYDSVVVERQTDIDRTRDTILIRERETRYKYRLVHDSIYINKIDSIPYTVTIEKRETVPKGTLDYIAYASLFLTLFYLARKLL